MAKYKAVPGYTVKVSDKKSIEFNKVGVYETELKGEIDVLDKLAPRYITKEAEKAVEEPAQPKASAKGGAKGSAK